MAKKKSEPAPDRPKQHEAIEALSLIFDKIQKSKFNLDEASLLENYLRRGIVGLRLLDLIRKYLIDTPSMGGEESPFVKKIDEIIPRLTPAEPPRPLQT